MSIAALSLLTFPWAAAQEAAPPEVEEPNPADRVVAMRATRRGPRPMTRARQQGEAATYLVSSAYGAYVGGNIAYLVDEAGENHEEPTNGAALTVGGLFGAAAGAGTAGIITARMDPTAPQMAALSSGMFVGGFVGHNIGASLIEVGADGRQERIQAAQLAGTIGGSGIAILRSPHVRSVGANLHLDLATVIGWQTAAGVSDMADLDFDDDRQLRSGIALAGGLAGFGAAAAIGPRLQPPKAGTVGLAVGDAAWLGAWTPYLFTDDPTDQQVTGGLRLGLGAGYLGTVMMAGLGEQPSGRSVALQALGASAGSALGAGIPLSMGTDGPMRTVVGPMLATGAAGQLAGALIAPRFEVSDDDLYLISTLGVWTGYQTVGWATFASFNEPEHQLQPLGYALTAGGAGTLITMASAPLLEVPPAASFQLLASGGWGTWFAGWGSELADLEPDDQWLVTLAGGDVAIIGTAIAEAAGMTPTWTDVGLINGMGAVGAAAGGLVGVIALYDKDNSHPMVISTLAGSGAGLVGGAVLASLAPRGTDELALPTIDAISARPSVAVRPWTDDQKRPGVWMELRLDEVARD